MKTWPSWDLFSKQNIFMTKRDMKNPKLGLCRGRLGLSFHGKILVNTWSLLFQKGTQVRFFEFFTKYFFLAFNSRDNTMLWVLNLFSRSSSTKLWKRIFKKMPQFFLCLKWPRKPQIVEYSTCVSCFNLEKSIVLWTSCH